MSPTEGVEEGLTTQGGQLTAMTPMEEEARVETGKGRARVRQRTNVEPEGWRDEVKLEKWNPVAM